MFTVIKIKKLKKLIYFYDILYLKMKKWNMISTLNAAALTIDIENVAMKWNKNEIIMQKKKKREREGGRRSGGRRKEKC